MCATSASETYLMFYDATIHKPRFIVVNRITEKGAILRNDAKIVALAFNSSPRILLPSIFVPLSL